HDVESQALAGGVIDLGGVNQFLQRLRTQQVGMRQTRKYRIRRPRGIPKATIGRSFQLPLGDLLLEAGPRLHEALANGVELSDGYGHGWPCGRRERIHLMLLPTTTIYDYIFNYLCGTVNEGKWLAPCNQTTVT